MFTSTWGKQQETLLSKIQFRTIRFNFFCNLSRFVQPSCINKQGGSFLGGWRDSKILQKGPVKKNNQNHNQFLSLIFVVPKKDTGHRPGINLIKLNKHITHKHFKIEYLFLLMNILQKGEYMREFYLKNAFFHFPYIQNLNNLWVFNGEICYSNFHAFDFILFSPAP